MITRSLLAAALAATSLHADLIEPSEPFDYPSMAFYPDRWEKEGVHELDYVAWEGEKVALVTTTQELDPKVMTTFVQGLDAGYTLYHELTGYTPRVNKQYKGKATICALPKRGLSCGYGCGYVGATGIEMTRFYDGHYLGAKKNEKNIPHVYFYEMGRNYFGFGERHNCFTTGFAVFMRYVCIDTLGMNDGDKRTRRIVDTAVDRFAENDMTFVGGFTNQGPHGEKGARLKDKDGKPINPSDQNVLYASLMLKLAKENGGNDFIKEFYKQVWTLPRIKPANEEAARAQCINLMIAASLAADKDLTPYFADSLKLKVSDKQRKTLAKIKWVDASLDAGSVSKSVN